MIGVGDEGADLRRRQQQQSVTHEDNDGFPVAPAQTEESGGEALRASGRPEDMDALLRDDVDDGDDDPRRPSDRHNIAVLLFLYVLQGILCLEISGPSCCYFCPFTILSRTIILQGWVLDVCPRSIFTMRLFNKSLQCCELEGWDFWWALIM